jgi:succinate dehydrogenase / fumarate reductase flavoprotein subunit
LSDLLVFGQRAGQFAAKFAKENGAGKIDQSQVDEAAKKALEPFDRGAAGENPFKIQYELQDTMQNLVGIVRKEDEMQEALVRIAKLKKLAEKTGITGHREYNGGWHTTIDLPNMLAVSEMIATAAIERKESRGGHFRDDYPEKRDEYSKFNIRIQKAADGGLKVERVPVKPLPAELQQVIEENK